MKKIIYLLMFIILSFTVFGLGDTFYFEVDAGNITLNTTLLDGTQLHCSDIIGETGDACNITSGSITSYDQSLNTTDSVTFVNITTTGYFLGDGSLLTGIIASANVTGNEAVFDGWDKNESDDFNSSEIETCSVNSEYSSWNGTDFVCITDSEGSDSQTLSYNTGTYILSITGGNSVNLSDSFTIRTVGLGLILTAFEVSLNTTYTDNRYYNIAGDTLEGNLNAGTYNITNVGTIFANINASYIQNNNWLEDSQESLLNVNSSVYLTGTITESQISDLNHTTNGTGLSLVSQVMSILTSYSLPQNCNDGEIAEYNTTSSGWDCAIDNSAASGMESWVLAVTGVAGSESITDGETVTFNATDGYIIGTRTTNTITLSLNSTKVNEYVDSQESSFNVNSSVYLTGTITESQISDLSHTVDTNETTRVDLLIAENTSIYNYIDTGLDNTTIIRSTTTAGGDLSGTYPNPTVNDNSHSHTYLNITPFTEVNLYGILSDVTEFVETGDNAILTSLNITNYVSVGGCTDIWNGTCSIRTCPTTTVTQC